MDDATVDTTESSTANKVVNYAVLGFAFIGAYQTTKFVVDQVSEGARFVKRKVTKTTIV